MTTGLGEEEALEAHFKKTDDYSRIIFKALADRLAEAFAEAMHAKVRRELWGYAQGRNAFERGPDPGEIPGHPSGAGLSGPARPHREEDAVGADGRLRLKPEIQPDRELRHVAGLVGLRALFHTPRAMYFGVGKVERDQVEDYARRKGWSVEEAQRWLAPVLNYRSCFARKERGMIRAHRA